MLALEGKQATLYGFMTTLTRSEEHERFLLSKQPLICEAFVGFERELSCLAVRGRRVLSVASAPFPASRRGRLVTTSIEPPDGRQPPDWALDLASEELDEPRAATDVTARAWRLVREAEEREDERHDEYDDPDQGGEA